MTLQNARKAIAYAHRTARKLKGVTVTGTYPSSLAEHWEYVSCLIEGRHTFWTTWTGRA